MKNTKNILALFATSFILLASSFTFSSCKDCGRKGPKPTDRDNKTNSKTVSDDDGKATSGDDGDIYGDDNISDNPIPSPKAKEELTSLQIQALVGDAVGYAYATWAAAQAGLHKKDEGEPPDEIEKEYPNAANAIREFGELMQKVAAAEKPKDRATAENVAAIGLLYLKAKREETLAATWAPRAAVEQAIEDDKEAVRARVNEQAKNIDMQDAQNEWVAAVIADSPAFKIAQAAFVSMFMDKMRDKGETEDDAKNVFSY